MKKPISVEMARKAAPRLWSRVEFSDDPDGCWPWAGHKTPTGHGHATVEGSLYYVHRVLWVAQYGLDPGQNDLDHLCRNPPCTRPDHLESVLPVENLRRGNAKSAVALRTGHCVNGHDLSDGKNVYLWRGARLCRPCRRRTSRERMQNSPELRERQKQYLRDYRAAQKARRAN